MSENPLNNIKEETENLDYDDFQSTKKSISFDLMVEQLEDLLELMNNVFFAQLRLYEPDNIADYVDVECHASKLRAKLMILREEI